MEALTFISLFFCIYPWHPSGASRPIVYLYLNTILPFDRSYGDISNLTLSPGRMRM